MKMMIYVLSILFSVATAQAKLNVVASTADIRAITHAVGGEMIELSAIAKGTQDPHYIEAKPSYMVKMRDADLLIANGLSLEIGWLPSLIRGARNPKINPGSSGYLDLGDYTEPIEKPTGQLSRSMGDVHPDGNPHFTLDPIRDGDLALKIAEKLGELDSKNKATFEKNAKDFQAKLAAKTKEWAERLKKTGVMAIVSYHPSLNYFYERFHILAPIFVEGKPGVPPTAQHALDVVDMMKRKHINLILVDNFFDTKVAERISKDVPGSRFASVGISVDSKPELKTNEDVLEQIVRAIENKPN